MDLKAGLPWIEAGDPRTFFIPANSQFSTSSKAFCFTKGCYPGQGGGGALPIYRGIVKNDACNWVFLVRSDAHRFQASGRHFLSKRRPNPCGRVISMARNHDFACWLLVLKAPLNIPKPKQRHRCTRGQVAAHQLKRLGPTLFGLFAHAQLGLDQYLRSFRGW